MDELQLAAVAASTGDVATLRRVLLARPELARDTSEHRPLIELAVREGHLDAVRALLDAGAAPDHTTWYGDSLITMALDRRYQSIVELLEGALTNARRVRPAESQDDHPIHSAAESGDVDRVRALLDSDPSLVNRGDRAGGTPLHRAVIGGAREVAVLLLDRGADIHAIHGAGLGSASGYAPANLQAIDFAIWGGPRSVARRAGAVLAAAKSWLVCHISSHRVPHDIDLARLLIDRGSPCDVTIAAALGDTERVAALLDADPTRIRETRPNGRRPLSAAIEFGHDGIARLLLDRGADPTWPDTDAPRGAALHTAARYGNRPLVELLLERGADPNGYVNASGTATFAAKTSELRRLLFQHGGRLDPYDLVWLDEDDEVMRRVREDPDSAYAGCGGVFTAVCTRGKRALLQRLLDAGVKAPSVAGGCQSYLLERPDMLRLLLARGAVDANYPNDDRVTLLHTLCSRDVRGRTMAHRSTCAAILLEAGATISAKDREYRSTPLAWAARNNLPDMVEFLLARGAPTNLPDDESWATPMAWAERRGHTQVAALLRQHGAR